MIVQDNPIFGSCCRLNSNYNWWTFARYAYCSWMKLLQCWLGWPSRSLKEKSREDLKHFSLLWAFEPLLHILFFFFKYLIHLAANSFSLFLMYCFLADSLEICTTNIAFTMSCYIYLVISVHVNKYMQENFSKVYTFMSVGFESQPWSIHAQSLYHHSWFYSGKNLNSCVKCYMSGVEVVSKLFLWLTALYCTFLNILPVTLERWYIAACVFQMVSDLHHLLAEYNFPVNGHVNCES
jgi:hypothetical protein